VSLPIRPDLVGLKAYGAPQLDVPVCLNTNENPFSPPAALVKAIAKNVGAIAGNLNRYPDRDAVALRTSLAAYLSKESRVKIKPDQVWAANGSNEIMLQILQVFGGPGRTALTFSPTYSMYEEYARNTSTKFVSVDRKSDYSIDAELVVKAISIHRPTVVFFTSPNNPTGTSIDLAVIDAALKAAPDVIMVVDEAYAEFRRAGVPSALTRLKSHPNLIVTRTMSKAFACAGVRLGYMAADPAIREAIMLVRLPYHLSTVTQTVALTALEYAADLQQELDVIRGERDSLVTWFRENGYEAAESDANFVLFGQLKDRHATWQALVDRGVLIREVGPAGWLRVTVGTPKEMQIFKKTLLEVKGLTS
jgi:histidinol-phosphate aminotransferase